MSAPSDATLLWDVFEQAARSHRDAVALTDGTTSHDVRGAARAGLRLHRPAAKVRDRSPETRPRRHRDRARRGRSRFHDRVDARGARRGRRGRADSARRSRPRRPAPVAATRRDRDLHRRRDHRPARVVRPGRSQRAPAAGRNDPVHRGHHGNAEGGRALARDARTRGAPASAVPRRGDRRRRARPSRRP